MKSNVTVAPFFVRGKAVDYLLIVLGLNTFPVHDDRLGRFEMKSLRPIFLSMGVGCEKKYKPTFIYNLEIMIDILIMNSVLAD